MSVAKIQGEIQADSVSLAEDAVIGAGSILRAERVILEQDVRIGRQVDITCDRIHLKRGCRIGDFSTILSPEVAFGEHCVVGRLLSAELNDYFRLGKNSSVGDRVSIVGRGFQGGEFLWLKSDVTVGGGGARGPNSYLSIGNRTTIIDKCFINLSEPVTIGDRTALSYNVVLLTHGAWQSPLKGYATNMAPIHIGDDVVVYLNAAVMPGVTIGNGAVVGASSLVLHDVPAHCLVAGSPARIRKGPEGYPPISDNAEIDVTVRRILSDYLSSLETKGVKVKENRLQSEGRVVVEYENRQYIVKHAEADGKPGVAKHIYVSAPCSTASPEAVGQCRFDLCTETMTGEPNPIAEDLRDYLRRRGIRIFTEQPFRSIPPANLRRLRNRKSEYAGRSSDGALTSPTGDLASHVDPAHALSRSSAGCSGAPR